jgi:thioredoxin 1
MAQSVRIVSIDIDGMPSIARDYQVASLPTLILTKEGRVIDFLRGAFPKRVVVEFLGRNLP